jgi:hypothetical protein
MTTHEVLSQLHDSERYHLRELAVCGVEPRSGIYALWFGDRLLYIGISTKDPKDTTNPQARGVPGRLSTYARARLTSDFAVAVAFRFVVPEFTPEEVQRLAAGTMSVRDVQTRVKAWIADNIEFSVVLCDGPTAAAVEREARRDGLGVGGPPEFNPA